MKLTKILFSILLLSLATITRAASIELSNGKIFQWARLILTQPNLLHNRLNLQ